MERLCLVLQQRGLLGFGPQKTQLAVGNFRGRRPLGLAPRCHLPYGAKFLKIDPNLPQFAV